MRCFALAVCMLAVSCAAPPKSSREAIDRIEERAAKRWPNDYENQLGQRMWDLSYASAAWELERLATAQGIPRERARSIMVRQYPSSSPKSFDQRVRRQFAAYKVLNR